MKRWAIIAIIALAVFFTAILATASTWDGDITEHAADGLVAGEGGQESQVLPWRIEGDLLLFFFLGGGVAAGFIAGYYWRKLFSEPDDRRREAVAIRKETG